MNVSLPVVLLNYAYFLRYQNKIHDSLLTHHCTPQLLLQIGIGCTIRDVKVIMKQSLSNLSNNLEPTIELLWCIMRKTDPRMRRGIALLFYP